MLSDSYKTITPGRRFARLFVVGSAVIALVGQSYQVGSGGLHVEVVKAPPPGHGLSPSLTLSIRDEGTGARTSVVLENNTASIEDGFAPLPGRVVMIGELEGRGKVISVIDEAAGRLIDTVWAWELAVSHNRQYTAYEYRYPPHGLPMFRDAVLLAYDFRLPPAAIPHVDDANDRKGFILYPEVNQRRGAYVIASESEHSQRAFTSPLAWSESDKEVAVLEHFQDQMHLVVVDITSGWTGPHVRRWSVDRKLFYRGEFRDALPQEYRQVTALPVSGLRFVDNDAAVELTSEDGGPYARVVARLSLADGSLSVVSKPVEGNHLQVPPELRYIRVGGPIQDRKVLRRVIPAGVAGTKAGASATVRFEALIDSDGRVAKLLPVEGRPDLVKAAEQAVRQWVYAPTALGGRWVAVLTTIEVSFPAK